MKRISKKMRTGITAFVAVSALFLGSAIPAHAITIAELEAQLSALIAQRAALQGETTVFTTDLTVGSAGASVTALQKFLISKGYAIPAGATGYFGPQTKSALSAFQSAQNIAPAVGYFGPLTRAKVNAMQTNTGTNPSDSVSGSGDLKGGEASLDRFRVRGGDDDRIEEGGTAEVAEIEFRAKDGDVRVNRIDLTFNPSNSNEEDEPWDAFKKVRLLVDGKKIAEADLSDEDDWLSDDEPYVFRLSSLNHIVREGKMTKIVVELEAQNGVVSNATDTWTIYIDDDGIRSTDSEGLNQYVGNPAETESFDLVEKGEGEALVARSSAKDLESTTFEVKDNGRSNWQTIFIFDLEAEDGDIAINDLPIDFTTGTADVDDVVDDVRLVIDRKSFDDYDWNGSGTFASTTFDIDGDYTVDEDDRVQVEVQVRFKAANGSNYAEGETITASVVGANIDAEGADDLAGEGNVSGEEHTLMVSGLMVAFDKADTTQKNDTSPSTGTFSVTVKVTAFGEDIYVSATSSTETADFTSILANSGISYDLTENTATAVNIDSSAERTNDSFRIRKGKTETITFIVAADGANTFSQLKLGAIQFGTSADNNQAHTLRLDSNQYKTKTVYLAN